MHSGKLKNPTELKKLGYLISQKKTRKLLFYDFQVSGIKAKTGKP